MSTVKHILDTRSVTKEGKHPIKIYVYHGGEERKFKTKFFASKEVYKNLSESKKKSDKAMLDEINALVFKAKEICDEMKGFFIWWQFKDRYYSSILKTDSVEPEKPSRFKDFYEKEITVDDLYQEKITEFKRNEQLYSEQNYKNSLTALNKFKKTLDGYENGSDLTLDIIDVKFLRQWEFFILKGKDDKPNSITTVKTYMRPLRCIFKNYVECELIDPNLYPFGKNGYTIGNNDSAEADIHPNDIQKVREYEPGNDEEREALDFWWFSLKMNGIAPIDIALLKKSNIQTVGGKEKIVFKRHKNRLKPSADIPVVINKDERINEIINRIGAKEGKFVFPILTKGLKENWLDYRNWLCKIRKRLSKIGIKLKLEKPLFLYASRHVFASELSENGFGEKAIANLMGNRTSAMAGNYINKPRPETVARAASIIGKLVA